MATNRLQGDLVRWRIDWKYFWLGKTIGTSYLNENPIVLMLTMGFKPTTS